MKLILFMVAVFSVSVLAYGTTDRDVTYSHEQVLAAMKAAYSLGSEEAMYADDIGLLRLTTNDVLEAIK